METDVFEDPRTGKKKTLFKPQADGALVPILDFWATPLSDLYDTNERRVVQGKRYRLLAANENAGRGLDYEAGKGAPNRFSEIKFERVDYKECWKERTVVCYK